MLTAIVFLPLVGAVLCMLLPKERAIAARVVALVTTLVDLALVVCVVATFDPSAGFQYVERVEWMPQIGVQYALGVDGISIAMLVLSALVTCIAVIASWNITDRPKFYFVMILVLEVGLNGVFLATDMVLFYLFWETVLVPMYFLIARWGGSNRSYAALKFFLYTFFGSVFMLVGIIILYLNTGTFDMERLTEIGRLLPFGLQSVLFVLFFLGFGVKVPIWPLHTWLPDAHVQAPTAVSALLAGVLLKMGLYGFLRVLMPVLPGAFSAYAWVVALLAVVSIIYGAVAAYAQDDVKKLVAYSSVSHMGFAMLGCATMTTVGVDAAIVVAFSHGLISAMLFLVVGMVYDRTHTRDIEKLSGVWKQTPVIGGLMVFASIAAVGVPGLSGFVGEFLALVSAWDSNLPTVLAALAFCGIMLGAVYMLSMVKRVVYGSPSPVLAGVTDASVRECLTVAVLIILIVAIGVDWNILLQFVDPASIALMTTMEV